MTSFLLILQFALAAIITISVLLQKSSSIGLGAYSGSNESLFGAKGPAGFLAKFTAVIGILFVLNTVTLGYFYQKDSKYSVIDSVDSKNLIVPEKKAPVVPTAPSTNTAPAAPVAPTK